jgi:prepilin-type processing-associated H-X9-DG protein
MSINSDSPEDIERIGQGRPFQFTLATLFAVTTVAAVVLSIAVPAFRAGRRQSQATQCRNNLKQIALAMHNYLDVHRSFPPAYIADESGQPMHSWRVLLLPFLEELALYKRYRFDEPWDGPNNRQLHQEVISFYGCPSDKRRSARTMTSYVVVLGPDTAWPGAEMLRMADFRDGTSNSILVVEHSGSDIHWMEPRDLEMSAIDLAIGGKEGSGISSRHAKGANVALVDGSVWQLPADIDPETLRKLLTINDGERVPWGDW